MLPGWKSFLCSVGATIDNGEVRDFGEPATETAAALADSVMTDLSYLAVVRATGADAAGFLHGQFTCDVSGLPDGHLHPGAWCNPRGQVIVNFIIARLATEYYILLPAVMIETFISRLRKFIFRAAVKLEDCSDEFSCTGLYTRTGDGDPGPRVAGILANTPQAVRQGSLVMFHSPVNWNRVVTFGPHDELATAWTYSTQIYRPVGTAYWQLFDVLDGQPWIGPGTTESFLPQYLNLDQSGGLSINKGCYPGQEIITRLQHKGHVRQRLYILNTGPGAGLAPGDGIYERNSERLVGTVVNAAGHPADGDHALAVMDTGHGNPADLYIKDNPAGIRKIVSPPATRHA